MSDPTAAFVARLFAEEWSSVLATLIRKIGDFDLAEDVAQEAFAAALEQWPETGAPTSPRAWLVQTARFKAINVLRRRAIFAAASDDLEDLWTTNPDPDATSGLPDDRLRLIFTCCHPALAEEAQVALTLRTLCGLRTEEIARAFLVPVATMAQRLVRAKNKIRDAGIPYDVPDRLELRGRLESVMIVLYALFNEGHVATDGDAVVRRELCGEAIRLTAHLAEWIASLGTRSSEVTGLLALMLLHDSRRETRTSPHGDLVLLDEQDRSKWDHAQIERALPLVDEALREQPGPYAVQAAIAALHARAARAADTDWRQIASLYRVLEALAPSPIVTLNRAAAVSMVDGAAAGLAALDSVDVAQALDGYHLFHAARADMLRRLGRAAEGAAAYRRALAVVQNEVERRFLEERLRRIEPLP